VGVVVVSVEVGEDVVVGVILGAGVHHRSFCESVVVGVSAAVVVEFGAGVHHRSLCVFVVDMSIEVSSSLLLNTATRASSHVGRVINIGLLYVELIEVVGVPVTESRELYLLLLLLGVSTCVDFHVGRGVAVAGHIRFSLSSVSLTTFLVLLLSLRNFTASAEVP